MRAVVGLGNPGDDYRGTRHNVGFLLVQRVAKTWGVRLKKRRFGAKLAAVERNGEEILLVMPQTYMNLSGQAVRELARHHRLPSDRLLVVYDDFELPLGEIRVRRTGGAGSHKGMASVLAELETRDVPRIRIGIGPLPDGADASDFVLAPFTERESEGLCVGLDKADAALALILENEIDRAMTLFN